MRDVIETFSGNNERRRKTKAKTAATATTAVVVKCSTPISVRLNEKKTNSPIDATIKIQYSVLRLSQMLLWNTLSSKHSQRNSCWKWLSSINLSNYFIDPIRLPRLHKTLIFVHTNTCCCSVGIDEHFCFSEPFLVMVCSFRIFVISLPFATTKINFFCGRTRLQMNNINHCNMIWFPKSIPQNRFKRFKMNQKFRLLFKNQQQQSSTGVFWKFSFRFRFCHAQNSNAKISIKLIEQFSNEIYLHSNWVWNVWQRIEKCD